MSKLNIAGLFLVALGVGVIFGGMNSDVSLTQENLKLRAENKTSKETIIKLEQKMLHIIVPKEQDRKLGQLVLNLMEQVNADLSPAKRQIIARTVVRVTNDIFEEQKHKEWFASVLAIESKFNPKARSSVGATGMSQLMPQYAKSFAKMCGITDYHPSDLNDIELNITYGACFFRTLLENQGVNGNIAAALVGYNAGTQSNSLKQLQRLINISNTETVNYIARFTYVSESAKNAVNEIVEPAPAPVTQDKRNGKK